MDHQFQPRQVNAARRHIGSNADIRPTTTQGTQSVRALLLRQLARQRHHLEPTIAHPRHQMIDVHPRFAKHDGGFRLIEPQDVEDRMLAVAHGH